MKPVKVHSKYLGLPLVVGQNKNEVFRGIEDKMEKKVLDWKNLTLSWAGKETLIKACLQSIPLYTMSCFKIPKSMCDRMTKLTLNFWWRKGSNERDIHWIRKEVLQKEKSQGGLGFRCFMSLNEALLMKHLWRFLKNPELLVSRIFKAKYFHSGDILDRNSRPTDSYAWKSICSVRNTFESGIDCGEESNEIKWKASSSGVYSVKSGYLLAKSWNISKQGDMGENSRTDLTAKMWRLFWKVRIPSKVKIVTWRLYHNSLPVRSKLKRRGCLEDQECVLCGFKMEDCMHLFIDCWWANSLWNSIEVGDWPAEESKNPKDWITFVLSEKPQHIIKKVIIGIWAIWRNRNQVVHGKQSWPLTICSSKVNSLLLQFENKALIGISSWGLVADDEDGITIYCDGSWSPMNKNGGYAAYAVKNNVILGCKLGFMDECDSVLEVEIRGILAGIFLAKDLNCNSTSIFSDSVEAVWAWQSGTLTFSGEREAFDEGLNLLSIRPSWSLNHVFREGNIVADSLAKWARRDKVCWDSPHAIPYGFAAFGVRSSELRCFQDRGSLLSPCAGLLGGLSCPGSGPW